MSVARIDNPVIAKCSGFAGERTRVKTPGGLGRCLELSDLERQDLGLTDL